MKRYGPIRKPPPPDRLGDLLRVWKMCSPAQRREFMRRVGLVGELKGPVGPQASLAERYVKTLETIQGRISELFYDNEDLIDEVEHPAPDPKNKQEEHDETPESVEAD